MDSRSKEQADSWAPITSVVTSEGVEYQEQLEIQDKTQRQGMSQKTLRERKYSL